MKNEIVLYRPNGLTEHIEIRLDADKETLWLTQEQIAQLFGRERSVITKHLKNIFKEDELDEKVVSAFFVLTTQHGAIEGKTQTKNVKLYNLDAVLSVGYRVNSKQGTHFRIWANRILREYLLKGYAINNRMNRLEDNLEGLSQKVNEISLQLKTQEIPTQGVFFDGQIFDAYELTSRIIRSAKTSIVLIDNYIDETTLSHLAKKDPSVKVRLLCKNLNNQVLLDIQKAKAQYGNFEAITFSQSHDRFLIIDKKEVYHLGASLKDLGKRPVVSEAALWFAFSKLDSKSVEGIMNELNGLI